MGVVAIVQARLGSTRLPGKVLMDLEGQPMLYRQLERIKRSRLLDDFVVATSCNKLDDALEEFCWRVGVACYRGSENDVLSRYLATAYHIGLSDGDSIVRLTADCPLTDWRMIDRVILYHKKYLADYTSNVIPPTYPDGLDVEVFTLEALEKAWTHNNKVHCEDCSEHVTTHMKDLKHFKTISVVGEEDLSKLKWSVDTMDDLMFVRGVYKKLFKSNPDFGAEEILELYGTIRNRI